MNLESLNEKQKEAVTAPLGPIAVIAGAGTGKTHVLTNRFIYLVEQYSLIPNRILAVTFTNKAASEMKTRISKQIHKNNIEFICTFHALAVKILKNDIDKLNRNKNFNIIDEEEQTNLLKEIYKEKEITPKDFSYKKMLYLIDVWKNEGYDGSDVEEVLKQHNNYGFNTEGPLRTAYEIYLSYLTKCLHLNLLDFNDLLIFAYKLLSKFPEVRNFWKNNFDYIMVDESQDINELQFNIILLLMNNNHDFFIVGDPDQTIYTWRGANEYLLRDIQKNFQDTKIIILDRNYRSTDKILKAANIVINENTNRYKKDLYTNNQDGNKVIVNNAVDEVDEADWVARKIEKILQNKNIEPSDICVLYRSKHLSRAIEQSLIDRRIQYKVIGGYRFYQRKEIKDLIAYFKVINSYDELSLKRIANIPRRKISTETISKLNDYAFINKIDLFEAFEQVENIETLSNVAKLACLKFVEMIKKFVNLVKENISLTKLFDVVYEETGYKEYLATESNIDREEYVKEFKQAITYYEDNHEGKISLNQYLQDIALFTSLEEEGQNNKNNVLLMTVHQAKGLEFEYVFLTNFSDDNFPSLKSQEENNIEEERRIAYVALTRAKKHLFISMNQGYNVRTGTKRIPSRFFNTLEKQNNNIFDYDEIKFTNLSQVNNDWYDSKNKIDADSMYNEPTYDFKIGDIIVHTAFGEGKVLEVDKETLKILFNNQKTKGIKILAKYHKSIKRKIN